MQVRDLNTRNQLTKVKYEAEITELNSMAEALENQAEILFQEREQSACELEAKSRALEEKDATISAMSEQIAETKYLATKQKVRNYYR